MSEHERRYRTSIGDTNSKAIRARYKKAQDKHAAAAKNKNMTYDDYIKSLKDDEKIINVDSESKTEKVLDFFENYFGWIRRKKDKYAPVVKDKVKTGAKVAAKSQPLTKNRLKKAAWKADLKLAPLKAKYGQQNVYFGITTSIAVLVLLGGFLAFRLGGGDSDQVAQGSGDLNVTETGFGEVQGAETPQTPDYEIAIPSDTTRQSEIFFDPDLGVTSFTDRFREHALTISQQPLTDAQKANKESELEVIGVNLLAEISFESQFGTTYITNTSPDGTPSQVAFFMTDELLIFIRTSGTTITTDQWAEYINAIQS